MARNAGTLFSPSGSLYSSSFRLTTTGSLQSILTSSSPNALGTASLNGSNYSSLSLDIGLTSNPVLPCIDDGSLISLRTSDVTGSSVSPFILG